MMKKNFFALVLIPLLLIACEKEVVEVEKPLYPTEGAINARFSVGDTTTVVFAQGNLQYQASTHTWRFASNQYDIIGISNEQIDTTYNGWIDLFGWGTSGYQDLMPYTTVDTSTRYATGEYDIANTEYDWGQHNPISNAGRKAGQWRTLTIDEWNYLFKFRERANLLRGLGMIQNVGPGGSDMPGLILLPDKWELPEGCSFTNGLADGFATNIYTVADWNRMQGAGAVFLPAGGYRDNHQVTLVGEYGCYWTSSYYSAETAYELYILPDRYALDVAARANGHHVRLVQNK